MAITIIDDEKKLTERDFHDCEIVVGDKTIKGRYERCSKSGDLRIHIPSGFGEDTPEVPHRKFATLKLLDGSGAEYHGTFDENGSFSPVA